MSIKLKQKYFVLLDDDFFFTKKTNLEELQRVIECNDFDMVGFDFFDYGFCKRNFQGLYEIKGETLISKIGMSRDKINGYKQYDYILNCFIGRTDFFKVNGWDEKIKIGSEHDDFFLNIKQLKPKITHITNVSISHYPKYTKEYKSFRKGRFEKYFFIFLKKNKLKKRHQRR
ncbi:glycosyltransferase family 2 protein [Moritella marina]|uniref:glycosyltransferase family 2 protein n=1 Tax=Moritella marina TaxID=90736 RepID=UPI003704C0B9